MIRYRWLGRGCTRAHWSPSRATAAVTWAGYPGTSSARARVPAARRGLAAWTPVRGRCWPRVRRQFPVCRSCQDKSIYSPSGSKATVSKGVSQMLSETDSGGLARREMPRSADAACAQIHVKRVLAAACMNSDGSLALNWMRSVLVSGKLLSACV